MLVDSQRLVVRALKVLRLLLIRLLHNTARVRHNMQPAMFGICTYPQSATAMSRHAAAP
jgi:hypothetical protein